MRKLPTDLQEKSEYYSFLREQIVNLTGQHADENGADIDTPIKGWGMDSIKVVHLIILIEQEYGITYEDGDLLIDSTATLEQLAKSIVDKIAEKD